MKKLDLNIRIDESKMGDEKDKVKIIINWISNMICRAVNKPNAEGRPSAQASMDDQRKYSKIMDKLEAHKNGIAEIDDDELNYLKRKFNQAEIPLNRDISKLLSDISKIIDKAEGN